jgi:N-acetyl sugar amidotransferase
MSRDYQICARCVMDTSDPCIKFDKNGVCNHCTRHEELIKKYVLAGQEAERKLNAIAARIRKQGRNKEYDSVLGVSGGADSTYTAYIAKKLGLRPLAVHLDNGWNAELAVCNIERTLKRLGIDLYTHVIDWDEFRDLQLSYLKSGVINIEALTDHAIWAILYRVAAERGIKYILLGTNVITEGILPTSWGYDNKDSVNIRDIHRRYGTMKLQTFPILTMPRFLYYHYVKGIRTVSLLNYVPYIKKEIKPFLHDELGWKDYSGKHGESIFTYFYQSYILPRRLKVDKRRAHLSCLVCAGEITREEALKELEKPLYTDQELREMKEYVSKKMNVTEEEFENYMALPVRSHSDFKTDPITLSRLAKLLRPVGASLRHVRKPLDVASKPVTAIHRRN